MTYSGLWFALHPLNQALGNLDSTVRHQPPAEVVPIDQHAALRDLVTTWQRAACRRC